MSDRNGSGWAPHHLIWWSKCPQCGSAQYKPAELRPIDTLLGLLGLHPVRCMYCWRRFYKFALGGVG